MSQIKITPSLLWPIVILIIAFGAFILKPWQTKPAETISVSATGKTQVVPDIAKISATIESKNPNLDKARKENEEKVAGLTSEIKSLGIDEKDIQTQYISGGPGYEVHDLPAGRQVFPVPKDPNTNLFTTTIEVTIRNFNNTDEVLAALTKKGATNLFGPNLTISDETQEEAKSKARENAVGEARKKAQELSSLSGRKLGKATKISELGDYGYPEPIFVRSEADLLQKGSQIQPGQNEVTINLQVDFSLK